MIALGSCKWTAGVLPFREKTRLDLLSAHLLPEGPPPRLLFFARSGFDDELRREAERNDRVRLVAPPELF